MLCAFSLSVFSQNEEEAWSMSIDTVLVSGNRYSSALRTKGNGSITWKMELMNELPKILGNADPIHYAQMLPGIQTNNEYKSGINIQGCDNSHNFIAINGAPLYNVGHLLGIFSAFNASHFDTMELSKSLLAGQSANRIGGQLLMNPFSDIPDSLTGELSVGLISSQGTLRLPLNAKTALTVSLRASYLNFLYSRWLTADGQQIRYSFYDANASLVHKLNNQNTLFFDYYRGNDNMSLQENNYYADMNDNWGNQMGSIRWENYNHRDFNMNAMLYATSYYNRFDLNMMNMEFQLPSSITDVGLNTAVNWKKWTFGMDAVWHHIKPQSLETENTYLSAHDNTPKQQAFETSFFVNYTQPLSSSISLKGGLRSSIYQQDGYHYSALDPSLGLFFDNETWQFSTGVSTRRQYLFQTGFSNIGLPSEFWMASNERHKPQMAYEYTASASRYLFGHRYKINVDLYFRKLKNQTEYNGSVLDYMNTSYDIDKSLLHGKGENYGFSVMINKCSGNLTGWICYSFTQANRSFDEIKLKGSFPASHERPHELNAVMTYILNKHWSFGGTYVFASGTPFTAPTHLAFINGNIMMEYGDHNGNRLKPYNRLDLSVNYKWHSRLFKEQGLNLSVYNLLMSKNELFYYIRTYESGAFSFQPARFAVDILPSISFFCSF